MPQRVITTSRLILRPPELSDAEAIFTGYGQDPDVTRYLIWRPHQSIADTEAFQAAVEAAVSAAFPDFAVKYDEGLVVSLQVHVEGATTREVEVIVEAVRELHNAVWDAGEFWPATAS